MTIDQFIQHLSERGRASKTCSGWSCCCPAHEDHTPSLSVSEGNDGRVLLHCFAGCASEAVVAAMGLTMADLMPLKADRLHNRVGTTQLVCAYDYLDESGALQYQVCRFVGPDGKKKFAQRRRWGDSWAWGLSAGGYKLGRSGELRRVKQGESATHVNKGRLVGNATHGNSPKCRRATIQHIAEQIWSTWSGVVIDDAIPGCLGFAAEMSPSAAPPERLVRHNGAIMQFSAESPTAEENGAVAHKHTVTSSATQRSPTCVGRVIIKPAAIQHTQAHPTSTPYSNIKRVFWRYHGIADKASEVRRAIGESPAIHSDIG